MSNIHYFQRYSQKENVVTNNTLLLLSRIYNESTLKFSNIVNSLMEEDMLRFGVRFTQQMRGNGSVPDGMIDQAPCRLLIETKLHTGSFEKDQLLAHVKNFKEAYNCTLLLLAPQKLDRDKIKKLVGEQYFRRVISTTFEELIEVIRSNVSVFELKLLAIIDDFEDFCHSTGLIDNSWQHMRLVLATTSLEDNLKYGLYYHGTERGYRAHSYIGLYSGKSIRGIGRISKIIYPKIDLEIGTVEILEGPSISDDEKRTILKATISARDNRGWNLTTDHVFFLADFKPCDFKKTTKRAPMGVRFFNLSDYCPTIDKKTSIENIVICLNNNEWS